MNGKRGGMYGKRGGMYGKKGGMYGKKGGMYGKRGGMYGKRGGMYGKRGVECGKRVGMVVWVPIMLLFLHGATVYVRIIVWKYVKNVKMHFLTNLFCILKFRNKN